MKTYVPGLDAWLEQAAKKPQTGSPLWDTQQVKDAYEAGFKEGRKNTIVRCPNCNDFHPDYKGDYCPSRDDGGY